MKSPYLDAGQITLRQLTQLLLAGFALTAGSIACAQTTTSGQAVSGQPVLSFNAAAVGVAPGSAQTLTATFQLTGYTSLIAPTAAMRYGLAYTLGTLTCSGSVGSQTCSVPVTFIPNYPGGRRDAVLLSNGGAVIATEYVYGVGNAPFALVQPGVVTNPISGSSSYLYGSVTGEDGTVYIVGGGSNKVFSVTAAGVVTTLPLTGVTGGPNGIAIDGAGILYISQNTYSKSLITYNTATGVQGTLNLIPPTPYVFCSNSNGGALEYLGAPAVGIGGDIYAQETLCNQIFELKSDGTYATTTINPSITQPATMAVDSNEDVFIGGYTINELTSGGTQTQINTTGASDGLAVDAANTLYATRYSTGGVAELPASGYTSPIGSLDSGSPLGDSLGPDGTLYVGNYNNLDKVDRSQGSVNFGEQSNGVAATPKTIAIYNGGNQALTISGLTISGTGYTLGTAASNPCSTTTPVAPGALCNISIGFTAPHAGIFNGSLTITSNSLNNASTTQSVALAGFVYGVYVMESPNPLAFGSVITGQTSSLQATLTNNGDLYSAGIANYTSTSSAFTITPGNCTSVAPANSCTITVNFAPTQAVTYTSTIGFSAGSSGGGANQAGSFTATGTGVPPPPSILTASPASLNFGTELWEHSTSPQYVTLTNTSGYYTATFGTTGSTDGDFTVSAYSCGSTLAPGATCQLSATFEPLTYANQSYSGTGSIQYTSNSGTAGSTPTSVTFSLSGNGITYPAGVSATPTSIAFGNQTEYTQSGPQTVYVLNQSGSTINFSGTSISGPFTIYQDGCGFGIPAGYQCTYLVAFYPKAVGNSPTGTLTIPFTGASGSPLTVSLTGNGTAGTPVETLYPSSQVNFGTTAIGVAPFATPLTQTVTLSNNGTAPMTNIVITITGTNATDYSETDNCAANSPILPNYGNSCTITVSFLPSAAGARNAVLNVSSNAGNSPQSVPLTGAGVSSAAQLQFTPAQLNLIAGAGGTCGDTTASTTATSATLCNVNSATQDYLGNTYLVDTTYNVVYKVDTTGNLTVFAGTPSLTGGYSGDNGPAASATLNGPTAVAADAFGNIFISDAGNAAVREVSGGTINTYINTAVCFGEKPSPGPTPSVTPGRHSISTCTSKFHPQGLIFDRSGNLYVADPQDSVVYEVPGGQSNSLKTVAGLYGQAGYNGDSISATTAQLNGPQDVAVDTSGNLYIADTLNYRVRKVDTTGNITTYAGYGVQGNNEDGYPATVAEINPVGVATNLAGDLYIGSGAGGIVRKVDITGVISTIAGQGTGPIGGPATTAGITNAFLVRVDNNGDVLIPTGLQLLAAGPYGILQFGSQAVNVASDQLNVKLEDTGNNYLGFNTTIATVHGTNASDFTFGNFCGYNLMGGKTCQLGVTFTPGGTGPRSAYLSIPTNTTGTPQTVLLQGNGTGAVTPTATLSNITFGNQPEGTTSAVMYATLTNTSTTSALTIGAISITGTNSANFALAAGNGGACGSTLAANTSCTIAVTFSPPGVQTGYTATLNVATNATGSPQTATLTGNGTYVKPTVTLSPSPYNFGSITVNQKSTAQVFTLTNTSTAPFPFTQSVSDSINFAIIGTTCGSTLNAGSFCTITVVFQPQSVAPFSAGLNVTDYGDSVTVSDTISGTGVAAPAPVAALTSSIAFPNTPQNTTATAMKATLSNTGNATLNITSIVLGGANAADFAIVTTANQCVAGGTLAAGASCFIAATFTPLGTNTYGATITVTDNSVTPTQITTLSGTGTAPVAALTSSINFPNTTQNTTATAMTATLSNTGNATLNITSIVLGGANAADFAIVTTMNQCVAGGTLAAGASCLIAATFTPLGTSTYNATITVTDNSATPAQITTLSGTGTAIPAPVAVLTSSINFPNTTQNATATAMTATLSNTGNATLNITSIVLGGANAADFALVTSTNPCGATLAAGASCLIAATFTPLGTNTYNASITVTDNSAIPTQITMLTGTGTAIPAPVAVLTPSISFPNTPQNTTATAMTTTLSNTGNATLNITSIVLGGTNAADFAIVATTNQCVAGGTLAAGASCLIAATFTPLGTNTYGATITVTDNSATPTQITTLSGTGTAVSGADFVITSNTYSQTVFGGTPAGYTITVTPTGGSFTGTITLGTSNLPPGSTATYTPPSLTPGSNPASSSLVITTIPQEARLERRAPWLPPSIMVALLLPVLWWRRRKPFRSVRLSIILLAALGGAMLSLSGCTGGLQLPSATYTISVSGTSGNISHTTTVTLTVQ